MRCSHRSAPHGGRITTARRLVVAEMLGATSHLSAEDVTDAIQREHPEIHLTTVYRTLESLETMGIVAHTHLGHGAAVYHLGELHQHLACEVCGRLIDVPASLLDELADHVAPGPRVRAARRPLRTPRPLRRARRA